MITDESKIVLHDDGKNGDKTMGDGVYSIVLKEDMEHVNAYLQAQIQRYAKLKSAQTPLIRFKSRLAVNDCTMIPINREIDIRKGIDLTGFLHFPLIAPVTETLKHNSLMVTDPSVLNDPDRTFDPCTGTGTPGGAWTFSKLITEMANTPLTGVSPETFLSSFLQTYLAAPVVNGDALDVRSGASRVIADWQTLCGGPAARLDINKAPFKLLAIVNRFDLRKAGGYGGGNAGEGRFVFCITNATCNANSFFIIFEYGVNKTTCTAIHDYAQQWADLEAMPIGTPAYNTALQAITDQFTLRNTNPAKPNGNSLNQIRSNEIALGSPWQLREFNISATSHLLENVTTKREPQIPFNSQGAAPDVAKVEAFGKFVNDNAPTVIADKMEIPLTLSVGGVDVNFLAGRANTQDPSFFHWDAQVLPPAPAFITSDEARMHISLNTCSGCHGGETNTGNFTHVGLPITATGATLSKFLTGNPPFSGSPWLVDDRAHRPDDTASPGVADIQWPFNDLERRGRDLLDFLDVPCPPHIFPFPPVKATDFITIPPVTVSLSRILTFDPVTMSH